MVVKWILGSTICFAALAQSPDPVDPVLRAKAQRTLENGRDLPPIPRGLIEPPPLPPPELHSHDVRKKRGTVTKSKKPTVKPAVSSAQKPQASGTKPATKSAASSPQKTKQSAPKTTSSAKPATNTASAATAKPALSAQKTQQGASKSGSGTTKPTSVKQ